MKLLGVIFEDFVNYKLPCMTLEFPVCDFKCNKECGQPVCQNNSLADLPNIEVNCKSLVQRYINNPITSAICCQGLEPLDSWVDLITFISELRQHTNDDIVIYTGYNKDEIQDKVDYLKNNYVNVVFKFGRYVPNQKPHYDSVLGIELASDNQYGERIS